MQNSSRVVIGVDDLPEIRLLLKSLLTQHGFTFLPARGGQECLALLSRVTPRLILLDIQMPGMDGFQTCRRIRENPTLSHIPIAFLTTSNASDDLEQGIAAGGNDFILKPFTERDLVARVDRWTKRRVIPEHEQPRPSSGETPLLRQG